MDPSAFRAKLRSEGAVVAGVLSGTSADGIDVGIARFRATGDGASERLAPPELRAFMVVPFAGELHARVRALLDGARPALREIALLHRDLGRAFGHAVRAVASRYALVPDLVGSHGQTVWHHDGNEPSGAASLQLGDGDCVAEESGAAVVSDFRQRDIAAGGEGAPISALADDLVFAGVTRPVAILNLGGMANLTWLPAHGETLAFDTGPAGSLLDGLARRLLDRPFDPAGTFAARGEARDDLVNETLGHAFFARRPPRSTGRDTFGEAWVDAFVQRARAHGLRRSEDFLATAVGVVAESVARAVREFLPARPSELVLTGGGSFNGALFRALERHTRLPVVESSRLGVDPKAREALVFAVLAARFVRGEAATRTSVTGARSGRLLGKLSPAP